MKVTNFTYVTNYSKERIQNNNDFVNTKKTKKQKKQKKQRINYKTRELCKKLGIVSKNREPKTLNLMIVFAFCLKDRGNTISIKELHNLVISELDLIAIITTDHEGNLLPFEQQIFIPLDEYGKGSRKNLDLIMTGKQIKNMARYIINLNKEHGIIIGIGEAVNDNNHTKKLELSTIVDKLSTIDFKKKLNLKKPYNPKPTATTINGNFYTYGCHSRANFPLLSENYDELEQLLRSEKRNIRYLPKKNKRKIYNLIEKLNQNKILYNTDDNYRHLILRTERPSYLHLKGKVKKHQPLVVEISKAIKKLLDKRWLRDMSDDYISLYITMTDKKIDRLLAIMEKHKYQKKTYQPISETNKYYYCDILSKYSGNVEFATNKLCGKITKDNLPERKKLMFIWTEFYDERRSMHNFEDWQKYDTKENIARQKQKAEERDRQKKENFWKDYFAGQQIFTNFNIN